MSEAPSTTRQAQVGEVVDIMMVNVERVLERDSELVQLDERADDLQVGANQLQTQTTKLRKKYWWQNIKFMIIIGVVFTVILIVIIVLHVYANR